MTPEQIDTGSAAIDMDAWTDIRRNARACHQKALVRAKGDRRAVPIVAEALTNADLEVRYTNRHHFGADVLGSFDRASQLVNICLCCVELSGSSIYD